MAMSHSELAEKIDMGTDQVRRYCKELGERNLINSRRREGQGRPWEYWRRKQPSALDIQMCATLDEAVARMVNTEDVRQHNLGEKSNNINNNNNTRKDAVKQADDVVAMEDAMSLRKYMEDTENEEGV